MAPKRKFRRKSSGLAKRVSILETKQAADDKTTEYKVSYLTGFKTLDNSWDQRGNIGPRTQQGVEAETNMTGSGLVRIGNEINLRHWSIEGYVSLPKSTDGTPTFPLSQVPCRIIIADNLTDNTDLNASDVLQNPLSTTQSLISPYKNSVAGGKRYRIHADYKFTLTGEKDKRIKFKLKLPKSGRVIHYPGPLDQYPSDFNISLMVFADVSVTGSNHPIFTYSCKSRFTDA